MPLARGSSALPSVLYQHRSEAIYRLESVEVFDAVFVKANIDRPQKNGIHRRSIHYNE